MQQRALCSFDRFDRLAREHPAVLPSTRIHPSVLHDCFGDGKYLPPSPSGARPVPPSL